MIAFLSPEWIAEYDRLVRAAGSPPVESPLVIEQRVIAGQPAVSWQLLLDKQGAHVASDPADFAPPAVIFTQTTATATAIAKRSSTAHEAFMVGDLQITGDVTALTANTAVTEWLDSALGELYAATDFGATA